MAGLRKGEWRISRDAEDWTLEYRFSTPYLAAFGRWWPLAAAWDAGLTVAIIGLAFAFTRDLGNTAVGTLVALVLLIGYPFMWYWHPRNITGAQYRWANRTEAVRVHGGKVDNREGQFDVGYLESLRVDGGGLPPGRVRLVFTSSALQSAEFLGKPGLPPETAHEIRTAVLDRAAATLTGG